MKLEATLLGLAGALSWAGCGGGGAGPGEPDAAPDAAAGEACVRAGEGTYRFATSASDELLDVLVDRDGAIYVAGYEGGTVGQTNIEPSGDARGVVLELDPATLDVRRRWQLDTTATDVVEALAVAPDGRLWWAGRTNGAGDGFPAYGQFDLVLGDVSGDALAVRHRTGTERPQHPRRLAFDGDGALVVAGYDDVYVPTNYVESFENPFVARIDLAGGEPAPLWTVERRREEPEVWLALATGGDAIAVGGAAMSGAAAGMYVRSLTGDADLRWETELSPIGLDMVAALHALDDGDLLWAGTTAIQLGERAYGEQDVVVGRLDGGTGEPRWTVQLGSARSEWVTDLAVDGEGRIYVVGETLVPVDGSGALQADGFLYVLDAAGVELASRVWGGPGAEVPAAVAVDGCGTALVAGYATGEASSVRDGFVTVIEHGR